MEFNTDTAIEYIKTAERHGAKLIVLPELGLTAYTCGDLFLQTDLIRRAEQGLLSIAAETAEYDILAVVGLPVSKNGKLYNCSAFLKDGEILGFVPKTYIPNYGEFYERRHFNTLGCNTTVFFGGKDVPIGNKLIFAARNMPEFSVAAEICEDVWAAVPPSCSHTENGAAIIVNQSASDEVIGKSSWRRTLIEGSVIKGGLRIYLFGCRRGRIYNRYGLFGHNMIFELGTALAESKIFSEGIIHADVDVEKIMQERKRVTTFSGKCDGEYRIIGFDTEISKTELERNFEMRPFVPSDEGGRTKRCGEIFVLIQYDGLKKRS